MHTSTLVSVTTKTRDAVTLLKHAEAHDMPLPTILTVSDQEVTLNFDTLADLTVWALWLDQPIDSTKLDSGAVHHGVAGEPPLGHAYVRCYYIARPQAADR